MDPEQLRAGEVGAVVSDATKGGYSQGTWSFGATVRARYAKSLSGLAVTHTTTHLKLATTLPDEYFRCERYGCDLKKTACVRRQGATGISRSATRTKHGTKRSEKKWIPPYLYWCGSGRCVQGAAIKASIPEQPALNVRRSGIR